eukprot:TRINITY_DN217_c0_g1_i1.p1 TRINITY_DN217_c0_g1~~TRINITY_DN217_c0_g1_i1.p1  ORF type:complete len:381 (-),score=89.84 TRINITY_DN217_c0_g1_i1:112-1254(-)
MAAPWRVAAVLLSCLSTGSSVILHSRHVKREPPATLDAGQNATNKTAAQAVQLPAFMRKMASDCQCHFREVCSCEASTAFMQCIQDACSSHKCDCDGGFHFDNACQQMAGVCPTVDLTCSAGAATCTEDNKVKTVQYQAAGNATQVPAAKPAAAAAPIKEEATKAEKAPSTPPAKAAEPAPVPATTTPAAAAAAPSAQDLIEPKMSIKDVLMSSLPYILLVCAVAYWHHQRKKVVPPQKMGHEGDEFTHGFCDIMDRSEAGNICLWSFCCPAIRWAETASDSKVNFLSFWPALLVFIGLSTLAAACRNTGHALLGAVVGTLFLYTVVTHRQKLRGIFGHSPGTVKSVLLDTLAWACCPCCAIIQEAREVEYIAVKMPGRS